MSSSFNPPILSERLLRASSSCWECDGEQDRAPEVNPRALHMHDETARWKQNEYYVSLVILSLSTLPFYWFYLYKHDNLSPHVKVVKTIFPALHDFPATTLFSLLSFTI